MAAAAAAAAAFGMVRRRLARGIGRTEPERRVSPPAGARVAGGGEEGFTQRCVLQLRREARLRREYLYRKGREDAQRAAREKKEKLRRALEGGQPLARGSAD